MKTKLLVVVLMLSVAAAPHTARADSAAEAKKAFREGGRLFEAKKYAEAAEQFRRAFEIRPNWKILYNIAQSEAAAKNYGVALEVFERYLADGGDDIEVARTNEVLGEIERLKKMVGYLEISRAEDSLSVFVDGIHRGDTPLAGPLALTAGVEHIVTIRRRDETILERTVRIPGGQTTTLPLEDDAPAAAETAASDAGDGGGNAPSADAGKRYRAMTVAGWSLLGVGAGALIGAAVTGALAVSKDNELAPQCEGGCPPELEEDKLAVDHLALATDVLLGVGAAMAVTGVVLVAVGVVKKKESVKDVALRPVVGQGTVGFTMTGEF